MSENKQKHPSILLQEALERLGMSQKELAIRTCVSEKHISTVIRGDKRISPAFARKLDIALGVKEGTWAECQAKYDVFEAKEAEEKQISSDERDVFKQMKEVVDCFIAGGMMDNQCGFDTKVIRLRKVLCVNNLTAIPQLTYNAAFRAQTRGCVVDPYILFAWQRMCEILTNKIEIPVSFDRDKLEKSVPSIKELLCERTTPGRFVKRLKAIFASCGIAFEVVRNFRGAPVQGFIKSGAHGRVILCLTPRFKWADRFWFSLFHEVGHLLNGDLNVQFVDFDSVSSDVEGRADAFARDALISPEAYQQFIKSGQFLFLDGVKLFSCRANVPHWVTIGRLHKDGYVDWNRWTKEIPTYNWERIAAPVARRIVDNNNVD